MTKTEAGELFQNLLPERNVTHRGQQVSRHFQRSTPIPTRSTVLCEAANGRQQGYNIAASAGPGRARGDNHRSNRVDRVRW